MILVLDKFTLVLILATAALAAYGLKYAMKKEVGA